MVSFIAQLTQDDYNALQNPMVKRADLFTGADAGVKIAAAIAALPVGVGGLVDATAFPNPQTLTGFTIPPGVTVKLGPIFHTLLGTGPSIVVSSGGHLIGSGCNSPGQTTLKAANGFNKDVIQCGVSTPGTWWHNGTVKLLRVDGNKTTNTLGNGIAVNGVGETSILEQLQVQNCPNAGLSLTHSQAGTGNIRNCTTNGNGAYGVLCDGLNSTLTFFGIGGDNNPVTFGFLNPAQGGGHITLIDFKSEAATDVPILLSGPGSTSNLTLVSGNTLSFPGQPLIRITPTANVNHGITLIGHFAQGPTILIDDQANNVQVPALPSPGYYQVVAYRNGILRSL